RGGQLPAEAISDLRARISSAVHFARETQVLTWDAAAADHWDEVYPALSAEHPGVLGAICSRAEAQVLRLSCLYALLEQSAIVRQPHLDAALAVWRYAEASAHWIFGYSIGNPIADKLWHLLSHHPDGLTTTELHAAFHRHCSAAQINKALELMLAHYLITWEL